MLVGLIPAAALPVAAASGSCGSRVTWELDANGTLTISGTGSMTNYTSSPWKSYADRITAIVIESGVTTIGSHAFYELGKVKTATIPNTVTSIGEAAFCWCESLTAIDIPGSVTFIGEDAFWCCLDLKDVTFHEGLQTIDREAFQGCRLITALDFPESVQSIGYWAFGGCDDLVSVNIPGSVAVLDDSVFSGCVSLQTVTLHEGLTAIGVSAFAYCFELQNVAIPGSVQSISDTAFYLCEKLGTVTFNGAPPTISDSAFAGAVATVCYPAPVTAWVDVRGQSFGGALTWQSYSVDGHTYADTVVPPTCLERGYTRHACIDCGETYMDTYVDALGHHWDGGVTSGSRTTYTCTRCGLKRHEYNVSGTCGTNARWTLDTEAGILHITGTGAITVSGGRSLPWGSYISGIRHVVIDEGITSIGAEAFFECEFIETIQIPDTVKSIGYSAFVWCSALKEVIVPEGVTVIKESTFWGCESMETLILPSTLTQIENEVFYRCDSLKQLVIPDGVTSVGELAFWDCGGLEEMTIPASITELSVDMFSGCVNLRTVHLPDTLTVINQDAFAYCSSLQSITIPKSVVAIGDTAFYGCTSLKKVYIPGSVETFGWGVFAGCSRLDAIYFTGNPPVFHEEAFWNTATLVEYPYTNRAAWADVKQSYGGSVSWLYYHVTGHNYTSTVVEPTCEHRGYTLHSCTDSGCDFYYMDTYTEPLDHTWDKGTGTNTQWTYTCTRCGDTRIVYNITGSCGSGVYWSLNTETGVLRIYGSGRMNDYSRTPPWNSYKDSIRQVIIESGVTSIGAYAFYEHGALETIEVPDTVHSLGLGAFVWCEKLQGIRIPEGVTNIPEDCFWGCRSLADLSLPSTLRTISQDVFYSNESLTTLELPENLVSIGKYAFWQCTGLTSVTIPKGVTLIPQACFSSCSSLKSVTLHDGIVTIDRSAFSGCSSLRSLTLPKQLTTLGVNAFSRIAVTSLVIPANVTFIDTGVFYGASLTSIHFKGDAPEFDAKALEGLSIIAYYPRGNATWTAEVRQSYGGSVTWIAETPCSHRYEVTTTPPTCLDAGFSVYTCSDCGYTYQELGEPATGEHDYTDWFVEWEPSCDYEGYECRYCIHCGLYEWVTLPVLEHDYYTYVCPPTCYSGGYTEYWCGRCGWYYLDDYTDPLPDHDYSDWIQSYPASCVDEGVEIRYCSMCGWEESQCIPATGHAFTEWQTVREAAYGADGEETRTCDRCSHVEFRSVSVTVVTSGNFGKGTTPTDKVTYTLYSDGTMVLEGEGALFGTSWRGDDQPFIDYRKQVKHLIIGEGITSTTSGSLVKLSNLETIQFPSTLIHLPQNALMSSFKDTITELTIPATVQTLGAYSIGHYTGDASAYFTDVIIENPNIKFTDHVAVFNGGEGLDRLTLYSYGAENNVRAYAEKYGIRYVDLDSYSAGSFGDVSYMLYDGVLTLSTEGQNVVVSAKDQPWAAQRDTITKIEIGAGITAIEAEAFKDYPALTEVLVPDYLRSIGEGAFAVSAGNGATLTMTIPRRVEFLGAHLFDGRDRVEILGYYDSPAEQLQGDHIQLTLKRQYKLLLIGNSYSQDASNGSHTTDSQLFDILQAMLGEDADVTLALLCSGGKGINWHATQAEKNAVSYSFSVITTANPQWKSQGSHSSAKALAWTDWDAVSLQPYNINVSTGKESVPYPETTDEKFYDLEVASTYMLDHIAMNAPYADIYFYMHWAQTKSTQLNASLSSYNEAAAFMPRVLDYAGTETGKQFETIIPVGLSVQNARTTYLATLSYNPTAYDDGNLNLQTDAQIGLQRDGGHLSFNIGRYIAALTFAEMLIPEGVRADGYVLPDIRVTESVGRLPKEYTEIAQKAVFAAVDSWRAGSLAATNIDGYTQDPTVAAKQLLESTILALCATDSEHMTAAVLALLPADFAVESIVPTESGSTYEITLRFGYTYVTALMPVTVAEHTYDDDRDPDCNVCGAVREVAALIGDTNGDGKINNRDLGLLQQYLADMDVDICLEVCDTNADGKINNRDLGLLQQYLADFEVELG